MTPRQLTHQDYSIGWVCALKEELTAATVMLDMEHAELPKPSSDPNEYTLGSIADHNIAIACLPDGDIGNNPATAVATRMTSTFSSIKFWLMVGVGGGVPPTVRLGDVVISTPVFEYPGVIQWDLGVAQPDDFERIGALNKPPEALRAAVKKLRAHHERHGPDTRFSSILGDIRSKESPHFVSKYLNRESLEDVLFQADYPHEAGRLDCRDCDRSKIINREPRECETEIHYGLISSGNAVVKDAKTRDHINKKFRGNVLCFEMEAAGITNNHPCLVIRGVCGKLV
jgi:nucleoside phosphorylase